MVKKFIATCFAMLILSGVAHAQSAPIVGEIHTDPLSSCGQTTHCWQNWGAAPFAASKHEAFSDAKLDQFLSDAVKAGLPAEIVPFVKNDIRTHPEGNNVPTQYLNPGKHLDLMESRKAPMFDVTVGEIDVGKGEVKSAQAYGYAYSYKGTLYVIDLPWICFNWSLWHEIVAPQPSVQVAKEPCAEIDVTIPAGGYVLHSGLFARRQLTTTCRAIYGPGRAIRCDSCTADDALEDLRQKGYLLNSQPHNGFKFKCNSPDGCVLRMQEPLSVVQRTDDDIFWLCLTDPTGAKIFLTKDIHWYSFVRVNGGDPIAYVGSAPADWLAAGGVARVWHTTDGLTQ